jgi:hypothetical protein
MMRKTLGCLALAGLIALPVMTISTDASAASCHARKVNGTILGGVGGALLGGAVTHGSTGPIVGGVGGAVLGHEVGRSGCRYKRTAYRAPSRARYSSEAPRPVRKVYYDQYGNPMPGYSR